MRVDKKFRTYASEDQKREYHKTPPIKAVDSFLKTQFSIATNKISGLGQVPLMYCLGFFAWLFTEKQHKMSADYTKQCHQRSSTLNNGARQRVLKQAQVLNLHRTDTFSIIKHGDCIET